MDGSWNAGMGGKFVGKRHVRFQIGATGFGAAISEIARVWRVPEETVVVDMVENFESWAQAFRCGPMGTIGGWRGKFGGVVRQMETARAMPFAINRPSPWLIARDCAVCVFLAISVVLILTF